MTGDRFDWRRQAEITADPDQPNTPSYWKPLESRQKSTKLSIRFTFCCLLDVGAVQFDALWKLLIKFNLQIEPKQADTRGRFL